MVKLRLLTIQLGILFIALGLDFIPISSALGATPWGFELPVPMMQYKWVDNYGYVLGAELQVKTEWLRKITSRAGDRLFVRSRIYFHPPYRVEAVENEDIKLIKEPDVVIVDTDRFSSSVTLRIWKPGLKRPKEVSLVMIVVQSEPMLYVDPSCAKLGIGATQVAGSAKFLYSEIRCNEQPDALSLDLIYSTDMKLKNTTFPTDGAIPGMTRFVVGKSLLKTSGVFGSVELSAADGSDNFARHSFDFDPLRVKARPAEEPVAPPKPGHWSLGVSFTQVTYEEQPFGVSLSELAVTPKVAVGYGLSKYFDWSANTFITAIPYTTKTTSIPLARFYGVNARLGIRMPFGGKIRWTLSPGAYLWGMFVPGNGYGVKSLAGPQIFLLAQGKAGVGSYFGYLKFAPIGESVSIVPGGGQEIAFGGGYQPESTFLYRPFSLVLDYSRTNYTSASSGNRLDMASVSLGIMLHL